jgi:hypothetical protein
MKNIKSIIYSLLVFLLAAGSVFAGGGSRNGSGGAAELLIPVGTRGIAMGGATLANSSGIEALYWNPANVARSTGYNTTAILSHMDYIADIGVEYGAIATNIESFGTIAFNIKSLSIDDIDVTTVDNPDGTGATFKPQFLIVGFTYATMLSDRISVGLTANYISETLDQVSASGVGFNVGVSYSNFANVQGFNIALAIKNLGTEMKYDGSGLLTTASVSDYNRPDQYYAIEAAGFELPSSIELGASYQYNINEQNKFVLAGVFTNNNFYGDEVKIGGEYGFNDLVFLRAGYANAYELDSDYATFGLNAGIGLKYNVGGINLQVDYAYQAVKYDALGDNHIFSLGLGF